MLRAVLISALITVLLASAPPVYAQSTTAPAAQSKTAPAVAVTPPPAKPGEEISEQRFDRWARVLDRVEAQLKAEDLSFAILGELQETVDEVRKQVDTSRAPLRKEVDRIGALVAALGPPPKEGEEPEAENVAAQRRDLNQQLSAPGGKLKELDLLTQKANLLASQIVETGRAVLAAQLLTRTPSLLSSEIWAKAATEFAVMGTRILTSPIEWSRSPEVRGLVGTGYVVGAFLAVLAAAILAWYLRRWLIRRFGRKLAVEEPSYRMRVVAALAEATAHTTIPMLVVAVAYGTLLSRGLLIGVFEHLVLGIVVAVVVFSVLRGLPRAMLSPNMPQWRLTRIGDLAARLWYRRALALAVLVAIDVLLVFPFKVLEPSVLLRFTYAFVADSVIAVVFLAVCFDNRLWASPEEEARAAAIKAGEPPIDESVRRSGWWLVGRVLVAVPALAIPITALAGYGVLSEHIARRLEASAGVFLVALLLHGLARDLVAVFMREEEKPPGPQETANPAYVWSVLLLDIGLVVTIVFFLVPLWGGRWENIFERIGWALAGFEIGGRTFSLTDVLMGIAVFIILIFLVRLFQRFLDVRVLQQTRMDVGVRDALKTGVLYVGVVIAALVAINTAGIDLSGLAIIAGALSVGIGFGMQSIVNNFVSGLILLIERPIKVGDWIVVGQDEGHVKRISVRSTEIQTFSNASVIVPNSELIAGRVTNWMYKDRSGRAELPIGVAYGSDTAKVREVLLGCVKDREGVRAWPQPYVVFMDFGDSALLFQLRFHVRNIDQRLSIMSDVRFAIDAAFREAGIAIPFPQRDVHIIEASGPKDAAGDEPAATAKPASG